MTEKEKVGHNNADKYDSCYYFKCSECNIELKKWCRIVRENENITYPKYQFNYCPNCGIKIIV